MFNALSLHRVSNYFYRKKIPFVPKIIQIIIFLLFNSYIPYQAVIGKGTKIGHRGISVVINKDAIIGRNVLIRAQVVIGGDGVKEGAPKICDNVQIGAGAKIIGDIVIGKNTIIGANSVVNKSWPDDSIIGGIPAKALGLS